MSQAVDATLVDPRRPAWQRFLEVRGLVGGHRMPHRPVTLVAQDGVRLSASYLPGPPSAPAILHAHGFGAHRRKPAYAGFVDALARYASVLTLDLRGHGQSAGQSSLGDREVLDVDAGLAWLRAHDHEWVAGLGVSMGATSMVHRLCLDDPPDAVVAVSAPPRLHPDPRSAPMQRLHQLWTSPPHRLAFRAVTGVRVVPVRTWQSPPHPVDVVTTTDRPVLLVHGQDDHFFDVEEWRAELRGADAPVLWEEPAPFGHAEDGLSHALAARICRALEHVRDGAPFPARQEVV